MKLNFAKWKTSPPYPFIFSNCSIKFPVSIIHKKKISQTCHQRFFSSLTFSSLVDFSISLLFKKKKRNVSKQSRASQPRLNISTISKSTFGGISIYTLSPDRGRKQNRLPHIDARMERITIHECTEEWNAILMERTANDFRPTCASRKRRGDIRETWPITFN